MKLHVTSFLCLAQYIEQDVTLRLVTGPRCDSRKLGIIIHVPQLVLRVHGKW